MTDPGAGAPAAASIGEARTRSVLIGAAEMAEIDEAAQKLGLGQDALMESAGAAVAEVAFTELSRLAEPVVGPRWPARRAAAERGAVRDREQRRRRVRGGAAPGGRRPAGDRRPVWGRGSDRGTGRGPQLGGHPGHGRGRLAPAVHRPHRGAADEPPRAPLARRPCWWTPCSAAAPADPLREPVAGAVQLVNAIRTHAAAAGRPCRVLAVDTPTLVDLTSGERSDPVVAADLTVTFHRAKAGFALDPEARRLAGRYLVAPIGIPLEAEAGIVPADGEYPPARITEVTWQEPGLP